jgi:phospholipid/cholesterol/gamma-HCH transport system substrate-binding protein
MRRAIAIAAVLLAASALVIFATGSGSGGDYKVRAIFDNAFSVIPGEDVKIAGVKVGKIGSLDVTPQQKAAVVLDITRKGFEDFRQDATCTIRPQSLIGEKFVECTPTQPRPAGAQPAPPLKQITSGPGKGQYLLPVSQTSRPVDLDLLNNIMRLPYRERFTIILNELGVGLAGRGADLRQAIVNANPGLKGLDKVLDLIATQNRALEQLAVDSDRIMAPLSRDRARVADFVVKAGQVSTASAERARGIEANIQRLPAFLRQLKPTMVKLGALSDEMTPVLTDLGAQAPAISRFIMQLGPFSQAGIPSLKSLGAASVPGRVALVKARPIAADLKTFAGQAKPLTTNLAALTTSLRDTGGIERLMDYLFYQTAAINGYDQFGHYLRAALIVNTCSTYSVVSSPDCTANFQKPLSASSASARAASALDASGGDPVLARTQAYLRALAQGASPTEALLAAGRLFPGGSRQTHRRVSGRSPQPSSTPTPGALRLPPALLPTAPSPTPSGQATTPTTAAPAPAPAQPAPGGSAGSGSSGGSSGATSLLDYLLGG